MMCVRDGRPGTSTEGRSGGLDQTRLSSVKCEVDKK